MKLGKLVTSVQVNVKRTIPEYQQKSEEESSLLMDILSTSDENQGVELEF